MMQQKIVFIGGPGTGKSSVLRRLENIGYTCMPEISREITLQAQQEGIEQLFLTQPLLFSEKILEGRINQFTDAEKLNNDIVFFDRGIPSITAYMDYVNANYPEKFTNSNTKYRYTKVFQFLPWKEIYKSDNERYESFEEALKISDFLTKTYSELGYKIINIPFGSVQDRCDFIINNCK